MVSAEQASSNEGLEQPGTALQQLGAVPGTPQPGVLGYRVPNPGDYEDYVSDGFTRENEGAGEEGAIFAQAPQGSGAEAVIITTGENNNTEMHLGLAIT